jgi:hypothetical protein
VRVRRTPAREREQNERGEDCRARERKPKLASAPGSERKRDRERDDEAERDVREEHHPT